jgi:hypothetical protein
MKKKILSLLAAFFMLFGTSAMAQVDSTLEGDVNGDGVVDIADITAVIAIIKQNAEANPTYYWYVGNTSPEGMTPPNLSHDADATLCQWTSLGETLPTTSIKVSKADKVNYDDHTWYIAAPTAAAFVIWNANNSIVDSGYSKVKTFMIGDVSYDLFKSKGVSDQSVVYLHK